MHTADSSPHDHAIQWGFVLSSAPNEVSTTSFSISEQTLARICWRAQAEHELAVTLRSQPGLKGAVVSRFGSHDAWHCGGLSLAELHASWRH